MLWGWFKHVTFIVYFISIITASAPLQIIRHSIPEAGDSCLKGPTSISSPGFQDLTKAKSWETQLVVVGLNKGGWRLHVNVLVRISSPVPARAWKVAQGLHLESA